MTCTAEHGELALSLARGLGSDIEGAEFALDSLAIGLRRGGARVELAAVGGLCAGFGRGAALLLGDVLKEPYRVDEHRRLQSRLN